MTDASISLAEQIDEVTLCALGHADFVRRASRGEIKRPPEEVDRRRARQAACEAAAETLRRAERHGSAPTVARPDRQQDQRGEVPADVRAQHAEQGEML